MESVTNRAHVNELLAALLDLHLATHHTRVVQKAGEISFLGRRLEISPAQPSK